MFRMNQLYQTTRTKKPNFTFRKGSSTLNYSYVRQCTTQARLPIGYDDFGKVIERKLDFVDKSLFIKEVLDDTAEVAVITRPRRFGKTLNLSMLQHFLSAQVDGILTVNLFNNLLISKDKQAMASQGKYPVIFITFKDVKTTYYTEAEAAIRAQIRQAYQSFYYLLDSDKLYPYQKVDFEQILYKESSITTLVDSIKELTTYLYQYHGVRPWLLIDEYDTPLQSAYVNNYYDQMKDMMSRLLGGALKSNKSLYRAVITGILRVSKESIFSGVNNLFVYSILQEKYGEYFGFTEDETTEVLKQFNLENKIADVRNWYNGYQMGNAIVYNPWSISSYVANKGELDIYWVNTSDNVLIENILTRSISDIKNDFEKLFQGECIEKFADVHFTFGDLKKNKVGPIWSLLLMSGYLKVKEQSLEQGLKKCKLAIPNYEVRSLYQKIIEEWLANGREIEWYKNFINSLLNGDIEKFEKVLTTIMEQIVSFHDTAKEPEAFYHGLMIGITASLYKHDNYELRSNRESGYGRYDYLIFSRDSNRPTILLEFKKAEPLKKEDPLKLAERLKKEAIKAIEQINLQKYAVEAVQRGNTNILKVALVFCGKAFAIQHQYEQVEQKQKISRPRM